MTACNRCHNCIACHVCGLSTDDDRLMVGSSWLIIVPHMQQVCDVCEIGCHTYCAAPPLKAVPSGAWKCQKCDCSFARSPSQLTQLRQMLRLRRQRSVGHALGARIQPMLPLRAHGRRRAAPPLSRVPDRVPASRHVADD